MKNQLQPPARRGGGTSRLFRSVVEGLLPEARQNEHAPAKSGEAAEGLSLQRPAVSPVVRIVFEVLVIGGLIPAALVAVASGALLQALLPMLYLAPLVLGLRYGYLAGAGAAVLTSMALAAALHYNPAALAAFSKTHFVALILVGMVSGQACEIWASRTRRLSQLGRYHQTRLEQFTAAYHLLKVSHSQLEQRVAGGALNLRTALERLRQQEPLLDATHHEPLGGIAEQLLEILVEQGSLYTAAVYEINDRGLLQVPAVAKAGIAPELSVFNPLLRETLRTGMLTSVQAGQEAEQEHVIAIVPLVDSAGHIYGVVSIHDMPFLNVNQDTFGLLGVLGKHIGDILSRVTRPMDETRGAGTLREGLQHHLVDASKHGLPSALLACKVVDAARRELLVAHCSQSGRGLDQSWISSDRWGHPVVLKLLPLTDEFGATTLKRRIQKERLAGEPVRDGIVTYLWPLDGNRKADELLKEVCETCDIESLDAVAATPLPPPKEAAR